jgi:transcription-repair coupling factor (superfamily II helicase)
MNNKQVAILVPTTVLAQQHFPTFTERLQTFPLRVEMLSRFCPPGKEVEILEGLANGTVDICIGTHRLLQKDVTFKDLGLAIIDEEQQFGVVQKEKPNILAMSALLTTTMPRMKDVIEALKRSNLRDKVRVMVGGAPVTQALRCHRSRWIRPGCGVCA